MKNIFKTLIFLFAFTACKAQTIYDIDGAEHFDKSGYYYKDVNNLFNKYEGTWLYTNGTTSLRIKLRKVIKDYDSDNNYYEDALIGEFEYIENSVIKVSTLSQFNSTNIDTYDHNINNSRILKYFERPVCNDCDNSTKRISIHFNDPDRKYLTYNCYIGLTTDTTPKLVFNIVEGGWLFAPEGAPTDRRVPGGHYILTKQ